MATNQKSVLTAKGKPLEVQALDVPSAGPSQLVIKNHALAINPVDWKVQDGYLGDKFPYVVGEDVAGEVYEVGSGVTAFKKGDRVLAHATGLVTQEPGTGGFQLYTRVEAAVTAKLPDSMSFTEGSVLPLAINTIADGFYDPAKLDLPLPSLTPKPSNKIIVVYGASSSVGTLGVQLAKASGLEVIATASSKNIDYTKSLGADHVFDYRSPSIVKDIVNAVNQSGKVFAGFYDAISEAESDKIVKPVLADLKTNDGKKKLLRTLGAGEGWADDTQVWGVFAVNVLNYDGVTDKLWGEYIPAALKSGALKALPQAEVVGKGLESLQKGLDLNKKGVSARKVVVEL